MTAPASPEAGRLTGEALEAIEARAADMGLWYTRNPEDHWLTEARIVSQDVPALCREVRRLRAALEEIECDAHVSHVEAQTTYTAPERFQRIVNMARRALANRPASAAPVATGTEP